MSLERRRIRMKGAGDTRRAQSFCELGLVRNRALFGARLCAGSDEGSGKRVEIDREPHCGHRHAESTEEIVVSTAARDRVTRSGGVRCSSVLVVRKAAHLAEIDLHERAEPALVRG